MRRPLPKAIRDAPELQFGLELYYGAFFDLHSCRSVGMGEGPIPWISIAEYCFINEVRGETAEDLFYLVRAMDNAYLGHREKQLKKQGKVGGSKK